METPGAISSMRSSLALLSILIALGCQVSAKDSVILPLYGSVEIADGCRLLDSGGDNGKNYHWLILQNDETHDYLSFFVTSRRDISDLIQLSDTACELFPDGRFKRPKDAPAPTLWGIRSRIDSIHGYEALEYSFVSDFSTRDDLRAHGYVVFGDVMLFVQHTSEKAITPELAYDRASRSQRTLASTADSKNLRRFGPSPSRKIMIEEVENAKGQK
ncbi:MAG: hypothetical protein ACI8T1_005198 [Verrucomicrobiales bacterium]|jgi:hypothetical protein